MRPSLSMKSMSSGMSVFFIQKDCSDCSGKTKSMPPSSGSDVRYIRPRSLLAEVLAISSRTLVDAPCAPCTIAVGSPCPQPSSSASTIAHGCTTHLRGISERMLNAIAFTVVLLVALGIFLYQVWGRFNLLRAATGAFTLDRIPERIRATLVYAFGQEKFIRPRGGHRPRAHGGLGPFLRVLGIRDPGPPDRHDVRSRLLEQLLSLPVHAGPARQALLAGARPVRGDGLRLHPHPAHALARHPAAPPVRLRPRRGAPPPPLALGGVPDPRLHRGDRVLRADLRRQPAARGRRRQLHRRRPLGAVLVPHEPHHGRHRRPGVRHAGW